MTQKRDILQLLLYLDFHQRRPKSQILLFSKQRWMDAVNTALKVSKCRVISGPYFPVFGLNTGKYGPEITRYLDTFHAVWVWIILIRPNMIQMKKQGLLQYNNSLSIKYKERNSSWQKISFDDALTKWGLYAGIFELRALIACQINKRNHAFKKTIQTLTPFPWAEFLRDCSLFCYFSSKVLSLSH